MQDLQCKTSREINQTQNKANLRKLGVEQTPCFSSKDIADTKNAFAKFINKEPVIIYKSNNPKNS